MTEVTELIDKQDNFEIIRDQIAIILANNVVSQMVKAAAEAKDPELWNLKIFTERSNPFEKFLNDETEITPIVNVWYDNGNFDQSGSNIVSKQKHDITFNIDCYGFGVSEDEPGEGHLPGDEKAAKEVQRAIRLVRNILMSSTNTYLGLRGVVWQRWIRNITVFQPQIDARTVQNVVGSRIAFEVSCTERSPEETGETLEIIFIDVKRDTDGAIVAQAQYCPNT